MPDKIRMRKNRARRDRRKDETKAPSINIQSPEKRQISKRHSASGLELDPWCFSGCWNLELGTFPTSRCSNHSRLNFPSLQLVAQLMQPILFGSYHEHLPARL